MQNLPQQINDVEERVAEMSLTLSPKEIAQNMTMQVRQVFDILDSPAVKEFRANQIEVANQQLQYRRISRANELIDRLMDGIEILVGLDPVKWKLQHVKMFELLMKDLPEQLKNFKQTNVQINNYAETKFEKEKEESIEGLMAMLPAQAKMEFWVEVEELAKKYIKLYEPPKLQTVQDNN